MEDVTKKELPSDQVDGFRVQLVEAGCELVHECQTVGGKTVLLYRKPKPADK